jgi:hypothetical protein
MPHDIRCSACVNCTPPPADELAPLLASPRPFLLAGIGNGTLAQIVALVAQLGAAGIPVFRTADAALAAVAAVCRAPLAP